MNKVHSLHRLCADYDRLGNSSFLVDFRALDRWQLRAERVMEGCFAPATADGRLRTALCRCLTCYFYQPFPDREDPWFAYLMAAADAWAARSDEPHLLHAARPLARRCHTPGLRPLRTARGLPRTDARCRPEALADIVRGRKRDPP